MMQVFVLSVQNAVERARIGSATALTQFSRQMGATIGVSVMGVIVNAGLPTQATNGEGVAIHRLPPALRDSLAGALRPAFLAATCVAVLVWVIAVVWVKETPLRKGVDQLDAVEAAAGTPNPGSVD
jgi:sugar phosphate permease